MTARWTHFPTLDWAKKRGPLRPTAPRGRLRVRRRQNAPPQPVIRAGSNTGHIVWPLDGDDLRDVIDRCPVGFRHDFSGFELFGFESLTALAYRYACCEADYFVAAGAPTPGTPFYAVVHGIYRPHEALEVLDAQHCRVLLKRPENHDPRFRDLLESVREEVGGLVERGGRQRIMRAESAIFVSSAATITPLHFDPEVAFFSQIEGEKIYHVYRPSTVAEEELEPFYVGGVINIGQVGISRRRPEDEQVFRLAPGKGFHQPQNAPHWVETRGSRSISYTVVFETDAARALGRTRACNFYLRRLGRHPTRPGAKPRLDAVKSGAMRLLFPIRRAMRGALSLSGRR